MGGQVQLALFLGPYAGSEGASLLRSIETTAGAEALAEAARGHLGQEEGCVEHLEGPGDLRRRKVRPHTPPAARERPGPPVQGREAHQRRHGAERVRAGPAQPRAHRLCGVRASCPEADRRPEEQPGRRYAARRAAGAAEYHYCGGVPQASTAEVEAESVAECHRRHCGGRREPGPGGEPGVGGRPSAGGAVCKPGHATRSRLQDSAPEGANQALLHVREPHPDAGELPAVLPHGSVVDEPQRHGAGGGGSRGGLSGRDRGSASGEARWRVAQSARSCRRADPHPMCRGGAAHASRARLRLPHPGGFPSLRGQACAAGHPGEAPG
mmetsp:Transcript_33054/g.84433  ORF Transcript_33054/g.84433 Transcript_33054/m.84433 type:complete len:325 (-) Transcript_33054:309-1283(-)